MRGSKAKGSYEAWNEVWKEQSKDQLLNTMYTDGEPRSIFQFWHQGYSNDLLSFIRENDYRVFCELGSGRGTTSMYLAKAGFTNITMVDLAEQAFDVAKHSFRYYKLTQPEMILGDVEATGLSAEIFDCIYNIGLLEHFDDPSKTLKESYRLLKDGGMIFMPIVPDLPLYKSGLQRLFLSPISLAKIIVKKLIGYRNEAVRNINRTNLRRADYTRICEEIGFKNIKCLPYNPFWKVNVNQNVENKITLPVYKWIYQNLMRRRQLSLKTVSALELCYLLIAFK